MVCLGVGGCLVVGGNSGDGEPATIESTGKISLKRNDKRVHGVSSFQGVDLYYEAYDGTFSYYRGVLITGGGITL